MCETAERILMEIGVATPPNAVGSVSFWFSWFALLIWLRIGTGGRDL
jgi:hypothetical protein